MRTRYVCMRWLSTKLTFILCYILYTIHSNLYLSTRIEENPDEAKIWVTSSGKDNALFAWDVWRRLPLHEVSIAFIIVALVSIWLAFFTH
jgi:hypothetical protein